MKLLEKILMPVDINKKFDEQLTFATKLSKEFNSKVLVMYVLPEEDIHPEISSLLNNYVNDTLNKIVDGLRAQKVPCSKPIIVNGNPTDKILQEANEKNVNLILAGSGNKTDEDEFKLGTTAEKLVSLSDVPVLVAGSNHSTTISKILCPVDFSDASKRAMKNAVMLSNIFEAELTIVSVFEPYVNTSPRFNIDQEATNRELEKQYSLEMETFLEDFDLSGLKYEVKILMGTPHKKILNVIKAQNINLLIMGTNGRSAFSRIILGSVTEKVIRTLPCSFLTTKTQDIFKIRFDNEIKEIETHFANGKKLAKSGLLKEAVEQFLICLQINDMHVPSIYKLAELYKLIGDEQKAEYYEKMAKDLLGRLWDNKIEYEIRKHYKRTK